MTAPGSKLTGREYDEARTGIASVLAMKYTRAQAARRAVTTVLAYLGAPRIFVATQGTPDGAEERKILGWCADITHLADRLDQIPQRTESAAARREVWDQMCDLLTLIDRRITVDHQMRATG